MKLRQWRQWAVAAKPATAPPPPPYWSIKGFLMSLLAAILLSWPMALTNGPLVYSDTTSYYLLGEKIFATLENRLIPQTEAVGGVAEPAPSGSGTEGMKLRSIPYSIYTFVTAATPLGLWITCLIQATIVLFVTAVLIPEIAEFQRKRFILGLVAVGLFSSLPWFVSYAMPDLLAALVVVFYLLMLRQVDGLDAKNRVVLAGLATAGVLAHYGNIPLAAGLGIAVIAWRWFEKSLTGWTVALCLAPVVLTVAFNVASGKASTGEESIAPARLPILLARSLEDGPARWYLQDACEFDKYTICELSETIPDNVGSFLWGSDGFRLANDAQVEAIRAEEGEILLEAFKRYPFAQTRALFGNALLQTVSVGTGELWPPDPGFERGLANSAAALAARAEKDRVLRAFDIIVPIATFLAIVLLSLAAARRGISYPWMVVVAFSILALLVNAAIFGGLSAPVDRYQSRIIWLLPAMLFLSLCGDRKMSGSRHTSLWRKWSGRQDSRPK